MTLGLVIGGVIFGVVLLGYVYHRWTAQTTAVINTAANTINTVIKDVKEVKAGGTVTTQAAPTATVTTLKPPTANT